MDIIRITQEKNGSIVKSQDESESQQEKKVDFYLYQTNKGVKVGCNVEDSLFSLKPYQGVINEHWRSEMFAGNPCKKERNRVSF